MLPSSRAHGPAVLRAADDDERGALFLGDAVDPAGGAVARDRAHLGVDLRQLGNLLLQAGDRRVGGVAGSLAELVRRGALAAGVAAVDADDQQRRAAETGGGGAEADGGEDGRVGIVGDDDGSAHESHDLRRPRAGP